MLSTILMTALMLGAPTAPADTVIPVSTGTRLDVDNFRGEVVVRPWDRAAVRVQADLSGRQHLEVTRTGSVLRITPRRSRGGPAEADLAIDVPAWMDLRIEGNDLDVDVRGVNAEVIVETVHGDIRVEGGARLVNLRSIQGEIGVQGARARVEANSVNEDITLLDIDGEVFAETTNGDVTLRGIRAGTARGSTMNGDILYEGTILDDGRYAFTSHNGDVAITIPRQANATVSVATFQGEFESEFPVQLTGTTPDRRFTFTLGSGSARIELESFNGEIQLRRP